MLMTLLNVLYVLLAVAMIVLILMQRGAGAQAGSGFGAGASATVFGARGAGNFLSKTTKWLAITFFLIALFMGWHFTHQSKAPGEAQQKAAAADLGLLNDVPTAPAAAPAQQPANGAVPVAPAANNAVPAAPAANTAVPAAPAPASTVAPK